MKKLLVLAISVMIIVCLAACGKSENKTNDPEDINKKSEGVMTYAEYAAAPLESAVVVEAYVQDHQSWWDGKISVYAADADGGYFFYNMECSEEDAAKLVPGTKIKVTGTKSAWSGEVEVIDCTFVFGKGSYIAEPVDVTSLLGTPDLEKKMNCKVSFKGMTVVASTVEGDENEYAFLYKWNNSGERGDDLYFKVSKGGEVYTFTVESYLRGQDTDVYKAVEALKVGDVIDLEGFLYWYEVANPHITEVKAAN